MKKLVLVSAIAFLAIGTISAQGWGNPWGASQSVTVNGTLQLQNGLIAVADGTTVYFVPILERYVGFIDGLKEGNRITVEGYAYGNVLQPSKVTIDGKTHDFLAAGYGGYAGYGPGGCWGYGGYGMIGYGGWGRGGCWGYY